MSTTSIQERLDAAIGDHGLLDHPFYRQWREGTLPRQSLATYAAEYGSFIAQIDSGWETVGHPDHAAEERVHAGMWDTFAASLGTRVGAPRLPAVEEMLATARRLFAEPETAWGALYAFEAQQPATAAEKLAGLAEHYGMDAAGPETEYFRVHAADYAEAEKIITALDGYGGEDRAVAACGEMAAALWDALSGVLAAGRE